MSQIYTSKLLQSDTNVRVGTKDPTSGLHDLEKCPHRQFDAGFLAGSYFVRVVFLQEFPNSLATPADRVSFPLVEGARGIRLEEMGRSVVVKSWPDKKVNIDSPAI